MSMTPRERIEEVIAWLKDLESRPGITFDMANFRIKTSCGTACCIAGAVVEFAQQRGENLTPDLIDEMAAELLGFPEDSELIDAMFYAAYPDPERNFELEDVTPAMAIKMLENYLETGEVVWDSN